MVIPAVGAHDGARDRAGRRPRSAMPQGLSDEQLMNRLAGPEVEAAISVLYDRYGRTVFGVGLKFLGDRSLAEDLVQEVFLKVWRSSHTFDASRSSFSTWLYRVTRSAASDMHRKRARNARQMPDGDPHFAALRDATPGRRRSWTTPGCPGGCRRPWKGSARRTAR